MYEKSITFAKNETKSSESELRLTDFAVFNLNLAILAAVTCAMLSSAVFRTPTRDHATKTFVPLPKKTHKFCVVWLQNLFIEGTCQIINRTLRIYDS